MKVLPPFLHLPLIHAMLMSMQEMPAQPPIQEAPRIDRVASAQRDQFEGSSDPSVDSQEPAVRPPAPLREEVLVDWTAPERPFKKRDREYYTTIGVIVFLLSIILFFAGQFLPIAVVVAFGFVSYALAAVPPEMTKHQITTKGIRTGSKLYQWETLGRFWFTPKLGQPVLHVEHAHPVTARLMLLVGDTTQEELTAALEQYLVQETPPATWLDRSSSWLQSKFPLEKTG
jgi:hypothetical protein